MVKDKEEPSQKWVSAQPRRAVESPATFFKATNQPIGSVLRESVQRVGDTVPLLLAMHRNSPTDGKEKCLELATTCFELGKEIVSRDTVKAEKDADDIQIPSPGI